MSQVVKMKTITVSIRADGTMRVFEPYVPYGHKAVDSLETSKVLWVVEDLYRRIDRIREELEVVEEPEEYPELCETYGCMDDSTTTSSSGARLCEDHFLKAEEDADDDEEEDPLDITSETLVWLSDGLYPI